MHMNSITQMIFFSLQIATLYSMIKGIGRTEIKTATKWVNSGECQCVSSRFFTHLPLENVQAAVQNVTLLHHTVYANIEANIMA